MTLLPDLFDFAYIPNWHEQLNELAALALPEPWRFKNPNYQGKNLEHPILEKYIQSVFRKQVIDYNAEPDPAYKLRYLYIANEYACFHTGLYTKRYKPIYGSFSRNKRQDSMLNWYLRGFADEVSPWLRCISPLPDKPLYYMPQLGINYFPDWPIRVNVDHVLCNPANVERLPQEIRTARNLPLLLETAVELARRRAEVTPGLIAAQVYQQRVQYLLPLCLLDMERPDIAMTLTVMDGYYLGITSFAFHLFPRARIDGSHC